MLIGAKRGSSEEKKELIMTKIDEIKCISRELWNLEEDQSPIEYHKNPIF